MSSTTQSNYQRARQRFGSIGLAMILLVATTHTFVVIYARALFESLK